MVEGPFAGAICIRLVPGGMGTMVLDRRCELRGGGSLGRLNGDVFETGLTDNTLSVDATECEQCTDQEGQVGYGDE